MDSKKVRLLHRLPVNSVEGTVRYIKAKEKAKRKAEEARKAKFDALLLERWQVRQAAKKQEDGHAEI